MILEAETVPLSETNRRNAKIVYSSPQSLINSSSLRADASFTAQNSNDFTKDVTIQAPPPVLQEVRYIEYESIPFTYSNSFRNNK